MILLDTSVLSWVFRPTLELPESVLARARGVKPLVSAITVQELGVGFGRTPEWPDIERQLAQLHEVAFTPADARVAASLQSRIQPPRRKAALSVWHRDSAIVATAAGLGEVAVVTGDIGMASLCRVAGVEVVEVPAPSV